MTSVPNVNMLPERWIRSRHRSRAISRWMVILTACAAGIAFPIISVGLHMRSSPLVGRSEVDRIESQIDRIRIAMPEIVSERAIMEIKQQEMQLSDQRIEWRRMIELVLPALPEGTIVRTLEGRVETTGNEHVAMDLTLESMTYADSRDCVLSLESIGLFDRVDVLSSDRVASTLGERVVMSVRARVLQPESGATP